MMKKKKLKLMRNSASRYLGQEGPLLTSQGPGGPALAFVGTSERPGLVLIGTVF